MKSLTVKVGVVLFVVELVVFGNMEVWGGDWKVLGTTERGVYLYDTESITRSSKNITTVWVQVIWSEIGVRRWVEEKGEEHKNLENLEYSLYLNEFDCPRRKTRVLSTRHYLNDGSIIDFLDSDKAKWRTVGPEEEDTYKAACK
jgi:hypothetical protein